MQNPNRVPPPPPPDNHHDHRENDDMNANHPGNGDAQVEGGGEKDEPFLEAFFVQSDWTGRVSRESWYHQHHPWRRILCFILLSSWAWSVSTLVWLYTDIFPGGASAVDGNSNNKPVFTGAIPIMQLDLTARELDRIKASHSECFRSFCEDLGRTVDVACIVNDDGVSARLELGEQQSEWVYFTEECHQATEATFGYRFLDGDATIGARPIALINIQTKELPKNVTASAETSTRKNNSILTLLPDCSIAINPASPDLTMNAEDIERLRQSLNIDLTEWEDTIQGHFDTINNNNNNNNNKWKGDDLDFSMTTNLLGLPNDAKQPDYREDYVLKQLFCPEEMAPEVQEVILPNVGSLYHWIVDGRHVILTVGLSLFSYFTFLASLLWLMLRLLWPAFVMKRFLSWPVDKPINYWDIWRNLVVLCLVSSFQANSIALTTVMTAGAWYYGNTQAAMEWALLGVLAWGAPDTVYPILDSFLMMGGDGGLRQRWQRIDFLGIVPWSFHILVVGEGWWKLVTLYVVGRSYLSLRQSRQPSANEVELEQMQLGTNLNQPQHPEVPYDRDRAHVKVD